jgi:hypothetical protein
MLLFAPVLLAESSFDSHSLIFLGVLDDSFCSNLHFLMVGPVRLDHAPLGETHQQSSEWKRKGDPG